MANADFISLSSLKLQYPSVPTTLVLKVINKFGNDHEKCKQALDVELSKYPVEEGENSAISSASSANNSDGSNNAESPSEENSVSGRFRELQVSHSPGPPKPGERHISTLQRSVGGNGPQVADQKPPRVGQSVSWTVQTANRQTSLSSGASSSQYTPAYPTGTPQTAPADFTPFLFAPTVNDIPQIDCNAHAGRLQQASTGASSSTQSPGEQRRPVKVINIPPGSLSGGSVSPASSQSNPRHIRMHFGDTGGVCTVSAPPPNLQRQAAQNANPHFRTELHTETSLSQPVHSSSIFVSTGNPNQLFTLQTKPVASGHTGEGRRVINPPMSLNTLPGENPKASGHNGMFPSNEPLSFPVQASSPGTVNSKPMFVEIKRDGLHMQEDHVNNSNQPSYFTNTIGRTMPMSSGYPPHPMLSYNPVSGHGYTPQYSQDFTSPPGGYAIGQNPDQFPPQQQYMGYAGPSMNLYQHSVGSGVHPGTYPHFNSNMYNYPGAPLPVGAHVPGQMSQFGYGPHGQPGQAQGISRISTLSSRSNSQESEHSFGAEFVDPRISFNTSHVSSHNSPSSESPQPLDRLDHQRSRTGSVQDESDYVRALLQHQKSRWQKMKEDTAKYRDILNNLRKEVGDMERSLTGSSHSFPSATDIARLCENNRSLQTDIQMYMNELEMYKLGQVPINEMNPLAQQNFFENMPTGQQDPIYSRTPGAQGAQQSVSPSRVPPPRPPPPIPARQRSNDASTSHSSSSGHHINSSGGGSSSNNNDIYRVPPVPPPQPTVNSGESEEGERWNCKRCTFLNFPALKECEMCGLLRDLPPASSSSSASASATFLASSASTMAGLSDVGGGPPLPPHHPLTALPPRLAPGLVGGTQQRSRSGSPSASDMFGGRHNPHHHAGS